jgi:hypothetical protein
MAQAALKTHAQGPRAQAAEHFDVLIVGAGISGVGGAYHLSKQCPGTSYVVLEGLETFGGTWAMHKYPGVRSDSDLYTFGYRFKPWVGAPIATADEILKYMGEVISENDLGKHIRYRHHINEASFSRADNLWTVTATDKATGETKTFTCNFLWMCQGYYRHDEGYTPDWPGMADFRGTDRPSADLAGGSGLHRQAGVGDRLRGHDGDRSFPPWRQDCKHITRVCSARRPISIPARNANDLAGRRCAQLEVDETWIHEITRRKILFEEQRDDLQKCPRIEPGGAAQASCSNGVRAHCRR